VATLREVVFDSEWTGFTPEDNYITEICCLELVDRHLTGKRFHTYLQPPIKLSDFAIEVTGLNDEFLADKPKFSDIASELLAFVRRDRIVTMEASLELSFLNAELERSQRPDPLRNEFFDLVRFHRERFPGSPATLVEQSKRYNLTLPDHLASGPGHCQAGAWLIANVYLETCKEFDL
jgi:DNA polymerase III subunit epsilon